MKAKTTKTEGKTSNVSINVKVSRVHQFDEKHIAFDADINGIKISGMNYIVYTNKQDEDGFIINFPSRQGKDGEYYNICWCPLSKKVRNSIKAQIEELL